MPVDVPTSLGAVAERAACEKYGLENPPGSTGFWDCRFKSNGRKVQVKSASLERADGPGVFRFWRGHLLDLAAANGSVVLVVVNRENPDRQVVRVVKESPATILAACRGRWRETGQRDMAGKKEARVPWPELVSVR